MFEDWLRSNHPEDAALVEFGDWTSVAEAERGGMLRAQYVAEWATDLEARNCSYDISRGVVVCQP